jgi:hypothetical protein
MNKPTQIALWIVTAILFTVIGVLIGTNRSAVGRFIAGEQTQQSTSVNASNGAAGMTSTVPSRTTQPSAPEPPLEPVIGWKAVKTETIEISPLDCRILGVARQTTRAKVSIDASSAVFFGIFPQSVRVECPQSKNPLRQNDFQRSKCGRVGVVQTEFECELEQGDTLVLRDKRAEGSQVLGALGLLRGSSDAVSRATQGNKVHYEVAEWMCVQHCRNTSAGGLLPTN